MENDILLIVSYRFLETIKKFRTLNRRDAEAQRKTKYLLLAPQAPIIIKPLRFRVSAVQVFDFVFS